MFKKIHLTKEGLYIPESPWENTFVQKDLRDSKNIFLETKDLKKK